MIETQTMEAGNRGATHVAICRGGSGEGELIKVRYNEYHDTGRHITARASMDLGVVPLDTVRIVEKLELTPCHGTRP